MKVSVRQVFGVPNVGSSATATGQSGFTVEGKKAYGVDEQGEIVEPAAGEDGGKDAPMPVAPLLALGLVAFAGFVRRRSQ